MEKFSAYRDRGTGIQPFLAPVPPQGGDSLASSILKPFLAVLGLARTIQVLLLALIYLVVVRGFCILLTPVTPIHNFVTYVVTALIARLSLFVVGVYWIPVEVVKRRRGRNATGEKWYPKAGDLIVSNWISWLEIAWLAFRFNPIFVLPVASHVEQLASPEQASPRSTPGRKSGMGSAGITSTSHNRAQVKRATVVGFREVSLLKIIATCGHVPPYGQRATPGSTPRTLDQIRQSAKEAGRVIVLFPECSTSNGRGLLRFSKLPKDVPIPVRGFDVFVMCVRIDPPTAFSPTLSLSLPPSPSFLGPLLHVFKIASSVFPHTFSIRLLAPSESPGSSTFSSNEFTQGVGSGEDALMESCASLMADIGRVKRTNLGWEDKSTFLEFYKNKSVR